MDDVTFNGPIILLNSSVFMWDVPQYGVGGPKGDVEPLVEGAYDNPASPFHGWTHEMLKVFELIDKKPGIAH